MTINIQNRLINLILGFNLIRNKDMSKFGGIQYKLHGPANLRQSAWMRRVASQNGSALTDDMRRLNHFIPALMTQIRQSVFPVTLRFTDSAVVFASELGERVYPDGRHLSRTFLRAGISSLSFKEFLTGTELDEISEILQFASTGDIVTILNHRLDEKPFLADVTWMDKDEGDIPGHFKHYTNYANYLTIIAQRRIAAQPHRKNGEVRHGVYLTRLPLSPGEAHEVIFIGDPKYRDRSTHVVAFDVLGRELKERIREKGIEAFIEDDLSLDDPRIRVRYHGPNYISEAKAA